MEKCHLSLLLWEPSPPPFPNVMKLSVDTAAAAAAFGGGTIDGAIAPKYHHFLSFINNYFKEYNFKVGPHLPFFKIF